MTHAIPNREIFGVHARYTCVAAFAVINEGEMPMPDGEHKYRTSQWDGTVGGCGEVGGDRQWA